MQNNIKNKINDIIEHKNIYMFANNNQIGGLFTTPNIKKYIHDNVDKEREKLLKDKKNIEEELANINILLNNTKDDNAKINNLKIKQLKYQEQQTLNNYALENLDELNCRKLIAKEDKIFSINLGKVKEADKWQEI